MLQEEAYGISEIGIGNQQSVWTTFTMCLEGIIYRTDGSRVVGILEHLAWLSTEWIPNDYLIAIVADYLDEDKRIAKEFWNKEARSVLSRYGLVNVRKGNCGSSVSIHGILQTILQERSKESRDNRELGSWNRCCRVMDSKVGDSLTEGSLGYKSLWAHAEALHKYANEMAKLADNAELIEFQPSCLGKIYYELGLYTSALSFCSRKYDVESRYLSPGDIQFGDTKHLLGSVYFRLGDYERAKSLFEDALSIRETHLRSGHVRISQTKNMLGSVYRSLGDYKRAKSLCEDALRIEEAYHPADYAIIKEDLGRVLADLDDNERAKSLYEDALRIKESYYPSDHVQIGITKNSLGTVCRAIGAYERAKELFEDSLRIKKDHYPSEHVEIAKTKNNLANVYKDLGEHEAAKSLYEDTLRIEEAHYPSDHVEIGATKSNLGGVYQHLGDYERAKCLYEVTHT